jgi:hypothetical protein
MRRRLDIHHVIKRSQGGSDFDLNRLVALCRSCHEQTDSPYARGRLVVTPLGLGTFQFALLRRADKRAEPERMEGAVPRVGDADGLSGSGDPPVVLPMWATRRSATDASTRR